MLAVEESGQTGIMVKHKPDAFFHVLSLAVLAERGAGWHEHPVHWPVLPPSGHQLLLLWDKTQVQKPGSSEGSSLETTLRVSKTKMTKLSIIFQGYSSLCNHGWMHGLPLPMASCRTYTSIWKKSPNLLLAGSLICYEFSSYQLACRGLCPHRSQLRRAAAEQYHIPWLSPPCSAISNFFSFSLFLSVLRATEQDIKKGCQKRRMKQHKERAMLAVVRSPLGSEGRVGEMLLYFDSLLIFTVYSLNLPFPSGLSKPGDLFRARHLNSVFPIQKNP